jgi:hypothetical protein
MRLRISALAALPLLLASLAPALAAPTVVDNAPRVAAAGRIQPLKVLSGLRNPRGETAVRLKDARVVLADYPLIKHDFGQALSEHYGKALKDISNDEIDAWLLDSAAYISGAQAKQQEVNSPIPSTTKQVTAYRPSDYGRAMVFRPAPGVLIDVKGSGAKSPKQTDHGNGLATLGEVIREFSYEQLVNKVFIHSKTGARTVGHYAVIDAGFDVKFGDGRTDRAGLILRQAHSRAPGDKSALSIRETDNIERTLRRYGITAAGAYQNEPYDAINLQGAKNGAVLDFGGFLAMPWFEKPAYHFDHTPEVQPKAKPLIVPGTNFPQPDERVRVPFNVWGFTETHVADPIKDNPWIWSHQLAKALRDGTATRKDAEQHLHNLLDPVDAQLHN